MKPRTIFGGVLPLFILGHFSHHTLTAITVPIIPFIRSAFNLDYTQSGFVISAFTLSCGISQLPAGWLADRIERRKLMTIGISGVALASMLVGFSSSYVMMMACLVLMGILAGGYHPSAPPLISASMSPKSLGRSLGLHNIGGGSSIFVTPLIVVTIANAWGWRNAYILISIPAFILGIIFYLILGRINARERAGSTNKPKQETLAAADSGGMRRLVIFLILSTFTQASINSTISFIPLLMIDHFGVSKEMAAVLLSLVYSTVFWASPLGGYLADRLGSVKVVLAVCGIAGPTLIFLTLLPYGWGVIALLLALGMVIFARMSASESYIIRQTPAGRRSTVLGIYYFTGMEGGGILTPLVGTLIDHFGFNIAFGIAGGAVLAVTLLCAFWLWEK